MPSHGPVLTGLMAHAGDQVKVLSCRAQGWAASGDHRAQLSTNLEKSTNVHFHFTARIPAINLTQEEVSVSSASYSMSLRKQMTPHSLKTLQQTQSGSLRTSLYLVMLSASFRGG